MATRQYIGARYVPKFYTNSVDGSTQWEANVVYEPLIYVTLQNGHMYISKKQVPATVGSPASNVEYWLDMGSYNGFIESLQEQIDDLEDVTQLLGSEYNSYINVKAPAETTGLTAVTGDGVTDDTANLNAIMQYALANDMSVFFPKGTYKISSITVSFTSVHKNLNLLGVGNSSEILVTGAGIIFINTTEASVPNYCKVENLKFRGASTSGTRLLQYINIFNGLVQNCLFENADIGLYLGSNIWGNIINCRFNSCGWDNVYMCGNAEDNRCLYVGNNAVNFIGCVSYGATRDGFECIGNSGCNFYGCTSESNGRCGISISKSGGFNGRGNLISGCWFEFDLEGAVYIDSTNSASDCNETISDCGFVWSDTQTANVIGIVSDNGGVLISGCHFRRMSGSRSAFVASSNLRCIHNRFSYAPTYDEIAGEHTDTTHCRVSDEGAFLQRTRDFTEITKLNTGAYRLRLNHWINSISITAEGSGYLATGKPFNQDNGTCIIDVNVRDINTWATADCPFNIIAM